MKIFSHRQTFEHGWDSVSLAFFQKYPNPYAAHVLTADVIERCIDEHGRLYTVRILLKTGGSAVPTWIQHLIKSKEAFVLEESLVDPHSGVMITTAQNLSHQRFMSIKEQQTIYKCPDNIKWSTIDTQAKFHCGLGRWTGIPSKLEGLGVKRFKDHLYKSRQALMYVAERIKLPLSG